MDSHGEFTSLTEYHAWLAGCAGKDPFPSKAAAEAFHQYMRNGHLKVRNHEKRADWDTVHAYQCGFCAQWHLGHPPK